MSKLPKSKIANESIFFRRMEFLLYEQLDILLKAKTNIAHLKSSFAVIATMSMLYEACIDEFVEELKHASKDVFSHLQLYFLNNFGRFKAEDRGMFLLELITQRRLKLKAKDWRCYFRFFEIRNKCMHPHVKHSIFSGISLNDFLDIYCAMKNIMQAFRYGMYYFRWDKRVKHYSLVIVYALTFLNKYVLLNKIEQGILKKVNTGKIKRSNDFPELNRQKLRYHIKNELNFYNEVICKEDIRQVVLP